MDFLRFKKYKKFIKYIEESSSKELRPLLQEGEKEEIERVLKFQNN